MLMADFTLIDCNGGFMVSRFLTINNINVPVVEFDTIVIGSGCAGLNAIDWLYDFGVEDIALVTEGMNLGTSRNTGSDKQTYYKLSLSSSEVDSVKEMAEALFRGKGVNGDTALVEAACSVKSFIKLANMGVPFPTNIYGEYVGYMTDHDVHKRATSAGPLTSKYMTEALEKSVRKKQIKIFDKTTIIKILVSNGKTVGALGVDKETLYNDNKGLIVFSCNNIILATGGPAGIYQNSVYPCCHTGMSGLAIEAGATTANFQEWQYGLASVDFRWNVSGTYQQVLPKYISIDENGNEREFLNDYFSNPIDAINLVFCKGYQWPFDTAKINGSSVIDMIIFNETVNKNHKVYMDFRSEPEALENGFEGLSEEARSYLENSGALVKTPLERLKIMNKKAIDLYKSNGIDLCKEPLRVEVCAQHNNGGIAVNMNWQTSIEGLYSAGEVAGTFGVYRPGGTALNSTQVGSYRAAESIALDSRAKDFCSDDVIVNAIGKDLIDFLSNMKMGKKHDESITVKRDEYRKQMSDFAAYIRIPEKMKTLYREVMDEYHSVYKKYSEMDICDLIQIFKYRDMLISQACILSSMIFAAEKIGTRGGSLVCENTPTDDDVLSMEVESNAEFDDKIICSCMSEDKFYTYVVPVRPLPESELWFEKVWNEYMERREK